VLLAPAGPGAPVGGAFVDGVLATRTEGALTAWRRRLVADPANLAPVLVRATLKAPGLVGAQALGRYGAPCTVVVGREDGIVSPREIEAQVPANVARHRVPGVGHLPQIEAAGLVRTQITRTVRAAG
jgi:pimeloyl-ACP methyl ester carboxylesterase